MKRIDAKVQAWLDTELTAHLDDECRTEFAMTTALGQIGPSAGLEVAVRTALRGDRGPASIVGGKWWWETRELTLRDLIG